MKPANWIVRRTILAGCAMLSIIKLAGSSPAVFAHSAAPAPRRTAPAARRESIRDDFSLPAPQRHGRKVHLWATWYWTPTHRAGKGVALRDESGKKLGPELPEPDFCRAAVEGALRIDGVVYTFAGIGKRRQANCARYTPDMPQAPYVLFRRSRTPFGEGAEGYQLRPFRSLAVDIHRMRVGTVLYVPAARGCRVRLPDGRVVHHDGYFMAADDGFGVKQNHVDVYLGISNNNPFTWVTSESWDGFTAEVVTNHAIVARLKRLHQIQ